MQKLTRKQINKYVNLRRGRARGNGTSFKWEWMEWLIIAYLPAEMLSVTQVCCTSFLACSSASEITGSMSPRAPQSPTNSDSSANGFRLCFFWKVVSCRYSRSNWWSLRVSSDGGVSANVGHTEWVAVCCCCSNTVVESYSDDDGVRVLVARSNVFGRNEVRLMLVSLHPMSNGSVLMSAKWYPIGDGAPFESGGDGGYNPYAVLKHSCSFLMLLKSMDGAGDGGKMVKNCSSDGECDLNCPFDGGDSSTITFGTMVLWCVGQCSVLMANGVFGGSYTGLGMYSGDNGGVDDTVNIELPPEFIKLCVDCVTLDENAVCWCCSSEIKSISLSSIGRSDKSKLFAYSAYVSSVVLLTPDSFVSIIWREENQEKEIRNYSLEHIQIHFMATHTQLTRLRYNCTKSMLTKNSSQKVVKLIVARAQLCAINPRKPNSQVSFNWLQRALQTTESNRMNNMHCIELM